MPGILLLRAGGRDLDTAQLLDVSGEQRQPFAAIL